MSTPLLDYAASRQAGERAATACAEKASSLGWNREAARACILRALCAGPMSGEELVAHAEACGHRPHTSRAFGPIFSGLLKRGFIRRVGHCPRKKGNGTSGGSVYRLGYAVEVGA